MIQTPLQKKLIFLLRAYIACWLLSYVLVYRNSRVDSWIEAARQMALFEGLPKGAFVWLASCLFMAIVAVVYFSFRQHFETEDVQP